MTRGNVDTEGSRIRMTVRIDGHKIGWGSSLAVANRSGYQGLKHVMYSHSIKKHTK